jgi:hypothetical protein
MLFIQSSDRAYIMQRLSDLPKILGKNAIATHELGKEQATLGNKHTG